MGRAADQACLRLIPGSMVCLAVVLLCACGAGDQPFREVAPCAIQGSAGMPPVVGSDTDFAQAPPRLSSQTTEQLLALQPRRDGSGFAMDLAHNRVAALDDSAEFTPGADEGVSRLENAAYCLYELRCFHQADTAALLLQWLGQAPPGGDCWIGLSDYERGRWNWFQLPASNILEVNPAAFSTADHYGYAVVVVLGTAPALLREVSLTCDPDGIAPYTLFSPMVDKNTYLINRDGLIVKEWEDDYLAASSVYLLDGLELLRPVNTGTNPIKGTGAGGGIKRWNAAGEVVWSANIGQLGLSQHHDIEMLPNGNILVIAWDRLTKAEAIAAGRKPSTTNNAGLLLDSIVEIQPVGADSAEIVWEWHIQDHLVQEFDPAQANYGAVAESPGRFDINCLNSMDPDLTHANSVDYNPELDQIAISSRTTSEFYIIDHSTTTAEAAGQTGGRYERGGDFLYRWGNPAMWGAGTAEDQILYGQHDVKWITADCPGAGHLLMYNNGDNTTGNRYSRILEIVPPLNPDGSYQLDAGEAYGPDSPVWQYIHDPSTTMFSWSMSGAARLPNGNTTICVAEKGWFLEVDPAGTVVWEYHNLLPAPNQVSTFRAETYNLFSPALEPMLTP